MLALVLGIGNLLLGDEGAGVAVIQLLGEQLQPAPWLSLVDGGTLGLQLLPVVVEATDLVVVDAVQAGGSPGTVYVWEELPDAALKDTPLGTHGLGILELLAACKLSGWRPAHVALVGIEPLELRPGVHMSKPVQEAVPRAAAAVVALLQRWGFRVRPHEGARALAASGSGHKLGNTEAPADEPVWIQSGKALGCARGEAGCQLPLESPQQQQRGWEVGDDLG